MLYLSCLLTHCVYFSLWIHLREELTERVPTMTRTNAIIFMMILCMICIHVLRMGSRKKSYFKEKCSRKLGGNVSVSHHGFSSFLEQNEKNHQGCSTLSNLSMSSLLTHHHLFLSLFILYSGIINIPQTYERISRGLFTVFCSSSTPHGVITGELQFLLMSLPFFSLFILSSYLFFSFSCPLESIP